MQICPKCGTQMEDNADKCPKCGAPNAFVNRGEFNEYIHKKRKTRKENKFQKEQEELERLYYQQEKEKQQKALYEQEVRKQKERKNRRIIISASAAVASVFILIVGGLLLTLPSGGNGEQTADVTTQNDVSIEESSLTDTVSDAVQTAVDIGGQVLDDFASAEDVTEESTPEESTPEENTPEEDTPAEDTPAPTKEPQQSTSEGAYKQTIMMYIVGSNLESENGAATADLKEITKSGMDTDQINFLVYTGGSTSWQSSISSNKNSIYKIENGKTVLKKTEKQKNMGKPATLSSFIDYCYKNYKSDMYSLILWDHGGGPNVGYGDDELANDDSLTMTELKKALSSSAVCKNGAFETIYFDACLMGSLEVASQLQKYASYLVASEESVPGDGLNYAFLKELSKEGMTGDKAGTQAIDYYDTYYKKMWGEYSDFSMDTTFSCVNLKKVKALEDAVNALFAKADKNIDKEYNKLSKARKKSKTYGVDGDVYFDLVDLYDLSKQMKQSYGAECRAVQKVIDNAVVYNKASDGIGKGITIYYPYDAKDFAGAWLTEYDTLHFASDYTKYIHDFYDKLLEIRNRSSLKQANGATVSDAGNGTYKCSLPLSAAQQNDYSQAQYYILKKSEDGNSYYIAGTGSDVTMEQGTLSAELNRSVTRLVNNSTGEKQDISVSLKSQSKQKKTFSTKAKLSRKSMALGGHSEWQEKTVLINVSQDLASGKCSIIDAQVASSGELLSSLKQNLSLDSWDQVQYTSPIYTPKKEADGTLAPISKWKNAGEKKSVKLNTNADYGFETASVEKGAGYYLTFAITDVNNQVHMTELTEIK